MIYDQMSARHSLKRKFAPERLQMVNVQELNSAKGEKGKANRVSLVSRWPVGQANQRQTCQPRQVSCFGDFRGLLDMTKTVSN